MFQYITRSLLLGLCFLVLTAEAQVAITEIMYDLSGPDAGREWIEVHNGGSESVSLSGWKFNDGSNHVLNEPPKNGGTGALLLEAGSHLIMAADAAEFLKENAVSVSVVDTVMSLGQQDDKEYALQIIDVDGAIKDTARYKTALGAKGDGNSLQKINGAWVAATPTPGNSGLTQPPETGTSGSGQVSATPAQAMPASNTSAWPTEPQLYARIKGPARLVVGADQLFEAEALGKETQPIQNARFVWNFGDGSVKEGQRVLHHYQFPGVYIVMLETASGGLSTSARLDVVAAPAEVSIAAVSPERVVIKNSSSYEIDLSWWRLKSGSQFFTLPKNTLVRPRGELSLSAVTMKLSLIPDETELWYPNGSIATSYVPERKVAVVEVKTAAADLTSLPVKAFKSIDSETPSQVQAVAAVVFSDAAVEKDAKKKRKWWWYTGILVGLGVGVLITYSGKKMEKLTADSFEIIE